MEGEYIPKEVESKKEKNTNKLSGVLRQSILSDLLILIAGLFIYFASGLINQVIGIVVGSFVLFIGAINVYNCVRKNDFKFTSLNLIFGILLCAIGIFIICSPHVVMQTLTLMIGLVMCILGINKAIYGWLLKNASFKIWVFSLVIGILLALFGILIMVDPFSSDTLIKVIGILLVIVSVSDLINLILIKKESKGIMELHW